MKRFAVIALAVILWTPGPGMAQVTPIPQPLNSVFIGDLTWDEIRDHLAEGKTSAIIATAGTEQNGPHMVMGKHRFILEYTTDKIARGLGDALVAPIITYVPEGSWENPGGHMAKAGTITLPNPMFMELLEHTAKSLKAGGFTDILFIGDSGGNQNGMRDVAAALNEEWAGSGSRAHWIGEYYSDPDGRANRYVTEDLGIAESEIGSHAGILDTSQLMFVNPNYIRWDQLAKDGGMPDSGVRGNPTLATPEIGRILLNIKIDLAVEQIRRSVGDRSTGDPREVLR